MSYDFYVAVVSGNCLWGRGLEDGRRLRLRSLQHRKYHGVTAIRTAILTWSAKYRSVSRWFPEGLRATDRSGCRVTATGAVSIDDVHHSCEWLSFYKMYYSSSREYLGYASSKFFTPLHVSPHVRSACCIILRDWICRPQLPRRPEGLLRKR